MNARQRITFTNFSRKYPPYNPASVLQFLSFHVTVPVPGPVASVFQERPVTIRHNWSLPCTLYEPIPNEQDILPLYFLFVYFITALENQRLGPHIVEMILDSSHPHK